LEVLSIQDDVCLAFTGGVNHLELQSLVTVFWLFCFTVFIREAAELTRASDNLEELPFDPLYLKISTSKWHNAKHHLLCLKRIQE